MRKYKFAQSKKTYLSIREMQNRSFSRNTTRKTFIHAALAVTTVVVTKSYSSNTIVQ